MSHFSVTDSAKSFGMPLNWDLMLSRPLAMETGSSESTQDSESALLVNLFRRGSDMAHKTSFG